MSALADEVARQVENEVVARLSDAADAAGMVSWIDAMVVMLQADRMKMGMASDCAATRERRAAMLGALDDVFPKLVKQYVKRADGAGSGAEIEAQRAGLWAQTADRIVLPPRDLRDFGAAPASGGAR